MRKKQVILFFISITALFYIFSILPKIYRGHQTPQNTLVANYIIVPSNNGIEYLKTILEEASEKKIHISFRGSGHSQGGHNYAHQGTVIDLSNFNKIEIVGNESIRVQAGATWKQVIEFLNPYNLSVAVMQSDYDFSIGGTISTNVHGWQANSAPIISAIQGLHILTADGNLQYCSRDENYDLFRAAIGGYGLLGVVIDVDIKVIPNKLYSAKQLVLNTSSFIKTFTDEVENNSKARLFFARFSLHKGQFLEQVIMRTYEEHNDSSMQSSLKTFKYGQYIINKLFALTEDNSLLKKIRWQIEASKWINKKFKVLSRNELLYHSTHLYTTNNEKKVDLLQEYFIPSKHFDEFTDFLKSMEAELSPHLMNLTLRQAKKDNTSILNYAKDDMICFVMFFRGLKTDEFDNKLKQMAIKITDKALLLDGSYYLPYRPFQTREQFHKSYPNFQQFKKIKEQLDPNELFDNKFYQNYLAS